MSAKLDMRILQRLALNFILKQLFDILGIEYKFIPLTKLKKTLNCYSQWWVQDYDLIKNDFI